MALKRGTSLNLASFVRRSIAPMLTRCVECNEMQSRHAADHEFATLLVICLIVWLDEIAGKVHETKGAIKEKVGRATNNPDLEDKGTGEKIAGKIQKKVGQVERVIEKP
jgi:uncharacterized protein YjbJ (UPF0337 family)